MTVRHGICKGGPMHGKVHAERASGVFAPDPKAGRDGGFYVFRPAQGPTPGEWRWVAPAKETGKND